LKTPALVAGLSFLESMKMRSAPFTFDEMYEGDERSIPLDVSEYIRRTLDESEYMEPKPPAQITQLLSLDDPEQFMDVDEEFE
jgi:hypothetical protein